MAHDSGGGTGDEGMVDVVVCRDSGRRWGHDGPKRAEW